MRVGLHALGIGTGADPDVIRQVAQHAESAGFSTLWCGEHVVMVERPDSPYPYADDKKIAVAADADWLDPLMTLSFAAACTSSIRLATGILLLPQHNPLVIAKQAASLDVLARGRFVLGVGIGWSKEEYVALGVSFSDRARRNHEFVEAIRALWRDDVSSYAGDFVAFSEVRSYPKPLHDRQLPIVLGGNSDAALARVADYADGWYGFNLGVADVAERVATLSSLCAERGRDAASVSISVSLRDGSPDDVGALESLPVDEVVVVEAPPEHPDDVAGWIAALAPHWRVG